MYCTSLLVIAAILDGMITSAHVVGNTVNGVDFLKHLAHVTVNIIITERTATMGEIAIQLWGFL